MYLFHNALHCTSHRIKYRTDGANNIPKSSADSNQYSASVADPSQHQQSHQKSATMKKIENKLKRLNDLGDINASKQTQIYLDALTDIGQANPQVASVLSLIQTGLAHSMQESRSS